VRRLRRGGCSIPGTTFASSGSILTALIVSGSAGAAPAREQTAGGGRCLQNFHPTRANEAEAPSQMSFIRYLRRMTVASGAIAYASPYSAAARFFSRNAKYSVPYALQYIIAGSLILRQNLLDSCLPVISSPIIHLVSVVGTAPKLFQNLPPASCISCQIRWP
jgi:hypothetical protein